MKDIVSAVGTTPYTDKNSASMLILFLNYLDFYLKLLCNSF